MRTRWQRTTWLFVSAVVFSTLVNLLLLLLWVILTPTVRFSSRLFSLTIVNCFLLRLPLGCLRISFPPTSSRSDSFSHYTDKDQKQSLRRRHEPTPKRINWKWPRRAFNRKKKKKKNERREREREREMSCLDRRVLVARPRLLLLLLTLGSVRSVWKTLLLLRQVFDWRLLFRQWFDVCSFAVTDDRLVHRRTASGGGVIDRPGAPPPLPPPSSFSRSSASPSSEVPLTSTGEEKNTTSASLETSNVGKVIAEFNHRMAAGKSPSSRRFSSSSLRNPLQQSPGGETTDF